MPLWNVSLKSPFDYISLRDEIMRVFKRIYLFCAYMFYFLFINRNILIGIFLIFLLIEIFLISHDALIRSTDCNFDMVTSREADVNTLSNEKQLIA